MEIGNEIGQKIRVCLIMIICWIFLLWPYACTRRRRRRSEVTSSGQCLYGIQLCEILCLRSKRRTHTNAVSPGPTVGRLLYATTSDSRISNEIRL